MTAELLVATQTVRRTPADVDLAEQFAAAAVGHPTGRPWKLWPVDRGVEVRLGGRRRAQAAGIGGQTIRIAAGAALFNMRLAIAALGHRPVVNLLPGPSGPADPSGSSVLAVLRRGSEAAALPLERALISAVLPVGRSLPPPGDGAVPPFAAAPRPGRGSCRRRVAAQRRGTRPCGAGRTRPGRPLVGARGPGSGHRKQP